MKRFLFLLLTACSSELGAGSNGLGLGVGLDDAGVQQVAFDAPDLADAPPVFTVDDWLGGYGSQVVCNAGCGSRFVPDEVQLDVSTAGWDIGFRRSWANGQSYSVSFPATMDGDKLTADGWGGIVVTKTDVQGVLVETAGAPDSEGPLSFTARKN